MGEGPMFIVFASLSMREASLTRLIADTTKAGGVVVFRGFPGGSTKAFAEGLKRVVTNEGQEAHLAIDPRLFRAFRVTAAPTFVAAGREYELCDGLDCTKPEVRVQVDESVVAVGGEGDTQLVALQRESRAGQAMAAPRGGRCR